MPKATSRSAAYEKRKDFTDPIDWAGHYWQQHHIEGDEQRFLAMTSLFRFERIVADAVETALKTHGLNITDYLLLMTLELSESGTRLISSLARNLLIHATTATLATDRLESRKMLYRSPHPTDRRATCITITGEGRETVRKASRALSDIEFGIRGSDAALTRLMLTLTTLRKAAGDTEPKNKK